MFSVVSWNVEFFGSKRRGESSVSVRNRIDRVFEYLRSPGVESDVYAIFEVNGGQVFNKVTTEFPDYTWQITEGTGAQLILIGTRIPAFITVRTEVTKGFSGPLRPGVLVTVPHEGTDFPMLFLHLKAADMPIDFGVRVHQHDKVRSLRKAVDEASGGQAPLIVAGDYNSVGLGLSFSEADITGSDEIAWLSKMYASRYDTMPIRSKTHAATFWNGPGSVHAPSDLDHVAAATNVQFAQVDGADIEVKGWPEQSTDTKKAKWISDYSDHALLRFVVTGTV